MTGALVLAVASVCLSIAYLAVMVILHRLPTGYSPIHHAVSDYAIGKYGRLFRLGLWASALSIIALAFALAKGVGSPPLATKDYVFLGLIPLARIGMTLFATNLEGQPLNKTAVLHYALAIAAFTFTYLAITDLTDALRRIEPTHWYDAALHVTAWIVRPALALVVITMITPLRRVFGLFERLFLLTTNIWFIVAAVLVINVAK